MDGEDSINKLKDSHPYVKHYLRVINKLGLILDNEFMKKLIIGAVDYG